MNEETGKNEWNYFDWEDRGKRFKRKRGKFR